LKITETTHYLFLIIIILLSHKIIHFEAKSDGCTLYHHTESN